MRGRPKKAPHELRDKRLVILVTQDELSRVIIAASRAGIKLPAYLRTKVLAE